MASNTSSTGLNIVDASIQDLKNALDTGSISSVDLITAYLKRIAEHDICGGLNAFTVFNENALDEAAASDARRTQGLAPQPLEGIPYTIKDSYSVAGMTVTNGSPALAGLMSKGDSALAAKLRDAGAILIGKTNMPPMAAGGMQRGLYGRAESPYNSKYLTAAFSSGSSNGAASSLASSMAAFGLGSETVSSGRSPASNNSLVCYTPSKGVLSTRGLWPLYVTCDVPAPYTRSVTDMLSLLDVIATEDKETKGNFTREQPHVPVPEYQSVDYKSLQEPEALKGKRIAVPKMYIGQKDSDPHAKPVHVSPEVIALWEQTEKDLKALGAEIIHTDFPLVTNYENDSVSGESNNVKDSPPGWNALERSTIIAKTWDEFLQLNDDPKMRSLTDIKDSAMLFPKPKDYVPDMFLEVRNWIDYAGLPSLLEKIEYKSIHDQPGMAQALLALEAQRKRDLEDWMDANNFDVVAFPAQGDVGIADLESNQESTTHSLKNGVKYSNGNRSLRHLGVPTVSVPMGVMSEKKMPVNITFAGKAYNDTALLSYAYAYEQATQKRISPPLRALPTDVVPARSTSTATQKVEVNATVSVVEDAGGYIFTVGATISPHSQHTAIDITVDGSTATLPTSAKQFKIELDYSPRRPECLGWDLKPLPPRKAMVIVAARGEQATAAKLLWVDYTGNCR